MENKKGVFIVFEGIDGCGKSTLLKRFASYLFERNKYSHIILTRNPYKDLNIRKILRKDSDPLKNSEILTELFIKDRIDHLKNIVIPNLKKGCYVLCDRYKLSTIAYQSAQGIKRDYLIKKQKDLIDPDITFLIDVSIKTAFERMKKDDKRKENKFEKSPEFLEKVRFNYLELKDILDEKNIIMIDGEKDVETIFKEMKNHFENKLINRNNY